MIIVNFFEINKISAETEKILKAFHYLFEYIKYNLLVPGKVETWVVIIDCRGVKAFDLSEKNAKKVIKDMGKFYPCRLETMFIIELPSFIKFFWKFLMIFIKGSSKNKVKILGSNYKNALLETIDPSNLEKKFGGLASNIVRDYFPPNKLI